MRASTLRILLGMLCLGMGSSAGALAAGRATTPKPPAAQAEAGPGTVWTAAEPANCSRVRRKLWQEGEGWIVKSVSVCR